MLLDLFHLDRATKYFQMMKIMMMMNMIMKIMMTNEVKVTLALVRALDNRHIQINLTALDKMRY